DERLHDNEDDDKGLIRSPDALMTGTRTSSGRHSATMSCRDCPRCARERQRVEHDRRTEGHAPTTPVPVSPRLRVVRDAMIGTRTDGCSTAFSAACSELLLDLGELAQHLVDTRHGVRFELGQEECRKE